MNRTKKSSTPTKKPARRVPEIVPEIVPDSEVIPHGRTPGPGPAEEGPRRGAAPPRRRPELTRE